MIAFFFNLALSLHLLSFVHLPFNLYNDTSLQKKVAIVSSPSPSPSTIAAMKEERRADRQREGIFA